MVAVHHLRKDDDPADWIDAITGSTGITGAVDTIAALFRERGAMDATLRITGRDLADEPELALSFQPDRGLWKEMGPAQQYRQSMERAAVLEAVRLLGGTAQVRDVAQSLEKSVAATSKLIVALADDSLLYPVKRGVYSLQKPVERGETVDTGTQLSTESTISTGLGEEDA